MQYGVIGNCKSAALVHLTGSIDWLCLPRFDSPSIFARILDTERGGHFAVAPVASAALPTQRYIPYTNVLETTYDLGDTAFRILDCMPRYRRWETLFRPVEVHRLIEPIRGAPRVRVEFRPALDYARGRTVISCVGDSVIRALRGVEEVFLYTNLKASAVLASEELTLTEPAFFVLSYHERLRPPSMGEVMDVFRRTVAYWESWSARSIAPLLYHDEVLRSALTLKLLCYEDTGAVVAAITTSLPEIVGESRNWDYRYCWLRDSSFTLDALKSLRHEDEASNFIRFLLRTVESRAEGMRIMYGIDGRAQLKEEELRHLSGYKGSRPVRIGNAAFRQRQHDIYGEILNTLYLYYVHHRFRAEIDDEVWSLVRFLVSSTEKNWRTRDAGLWEYRGRARHFTFSKVLSWVALDRGARIAHYVGREAEFQRWHSARNRIKEDILQKAFDPALGSFTQSYGAGDLDAANLLMPSYGFLPATDPRFRGTVAATEKHLVKKGFCFRYTNPDDFGIPKSAFLVCTFWLVEALYRIGEEERARALFDSLLQRANHLGLFSEDIDIDTLELTGNFPQGFCHVAVINTAHLLSGQSDRMIVGTNLGI